MKPPIFNAQMSSTYAQGAKRQVPGFSDLHKMMAMLLAEQTPANGRILVLGAGGGLELKTLAEAQTSWSFDGIDPSPEMLAVARKILAPYLSRISLHEGYIHSAPNGPFDAATSLLTFHFIPAQKRLETLKEIHQRLRPGAPFILAHISFPQTEPARSQWIARHVAFGAEAQTTPAQMERSRQAIGTKLTILSPEDEEAMLGAAGFTNISLFYVGLSVRGWLSYAG